MNSNLPVQQDSYKIHAYRGNSGVMVQVPSNDDGLKALFVLGLGLGLGYGIAQAFKGK